MFFYSLLIPCAVDRGSQTLTLPSLPDETSVRPGFPARLSTECREVVEISWPASVSTPWSVILSKISIVFDGADAEAA